MSVYNSWTKIIYSHVCYYLVLSCREFPVSETFASCFVEISLSFCGGLIDAGKAKLVDSTSSFGNCGGRMEKQRRSMAIVPSDMNPMGYQLDRGGQRILRRHQSQASSVMASRSPLSVRNRGGRMEKQRRSMAIIPSDMNLVGQGRSEDFVSAPKSGIISDGVAVAPKCATRTRRQPPRRQALRRASTKQRTLPVDLGWTSLPSLFW